MAGAPPAREPRPAATLPGLGPLLRLAWPNLRREALSLALYNALMKGLAALAAGPLGLLSLRVLSGRQGPAALGNALLIESLATARGLLLLLGLALLLVTGNLLSAAGLMAIGLGGRGKSPRASVEDALAIALRRLPVFLRFALLLVGLLVLTAAPIALAGYGIHLSLQGHDFNYYWTQRPPRFWQAILGSGLLMALLALLWGGLYLVTVFSLPEMLCRGRNARHALLRSLGRVRTAGPAILRVLLPWWLGVLGLGAILHGLGVLTARQLLGQLLALGGQGALSAGIAAVAALSLSGGALLSFLVLALYTLLVVEMDLYLSGRRVERLDFDVVDWDSLSRLPQGWALRLALALLLGLGLAGALASSRRLLEGLAPRPALVIAHRGTVREAPENSLAALEEAIRAGADLVELDVQASADGVPMVFHDNDLMRLAGRPDWLRDLPATELRAVTIGASFPPPLRDETMPGLEDYLAQACGRVGLLIELRYPPRRRNQAEEALGGRVLELLARHPDCRATVMSKDLRVLAQLRRRAPGTRLGAVLATVLGPAHALDLDVLALSTGSVDEASLRAAGAAGKAVYAWTVNEPAEMERLLDLGVDGLITDQPRRLRQLLEQREALSAEERLRLRVLRWVAGG